MGFLANWSEWRRSRAQMRAAFDRLGIEVSYNPLGITIYHNHTGARNYEWGIYRLNFCIGNEGTARYRISREDAFNTGMAMARHEPWHRRELALRPNGEGVVVPEHFPRNIATFTLPRRSNAHDSVEAGVVALRLGSHGRLFRGFGFAL
jgi:hypothetical protein